MPFARMAGYDADGPVLKNSSSARRRAAGVCLLYPAQRMVDEVSQTSLMARLAASPAGRDCGKMKYRNAPIRRPGNMA
jgi:hypothetical protein